MGSGTLTAAKARSLSTQLSHTPHALLWPL
jgi:hypothetical protein